MDLFLAPHNDDETLFGAYTLLRHRPHVIVVLRSFIEAEVWGNGATWQVREAETARACATLGCTWEQWRFRDDDPPWDAVRSALSRLVVGRVWAPHFEGDGHAHHDAIALIAADLWPGQVTWYTTYTHARGRTPGTPVAPQPGWEAVKREAMGHYASQAGDPRTAAAFRSWPIDEYVLP